MSSAAEDEEAAALETVKSVTLTQDSDGSIILHCPPSGGSCIFVVLLHICSSSSSYMLLLLHDEFTSTPSLLILSRCKTCYVDLHVQNCYLKIEHKSRIDGVVASLTQ